MVEWFSARHFSTFSAGAQVQVLAHLAALFHGCMLANGLRRSPDVFAGTRHTSSTNCCPSFLSLQQSRGKLGYFQPSSFFLISIPFYELSRNPSKFSWDACGHSFILLQPSSGNISIQAGLDPEFACALGPWLCAATMDNPPAYFSKLDGMGLIRVQGAGPWTMLVFCFLLTS